MLLVNIVEGRAEPILVNTEPVIVSKNKLIDFYDLVGKNTNYTYHPEETIADNFVLNINKT